MMASHDRRHISELARRCQAALQLLLDSYTNAQNRHAGVWNFAVPIQDLRQAGLAEQDLRWLVLRGYAAHATQPTASDNRRSLRSERLRCLTSQTGVVLTRHGAAWLRALGKNLRRPQPVRPETPTYDRAARELRVGTLVVKRFRQPAASQEWILLAFQEQGWPAAIDDPLPPKPGVSCKEHLHDTIHNLNRKQKQPLIHFYGDGTGRRVGWQWRP